MALPLSTVIPRMPALPLEGNLNGHKRLPVAPVVPPSLGYTIAGPRTPGGSRPVTVSPLAQQYAQMQLAKPPFDIIPAAALANMPALVWRVYRWLTVGGFAMLIAPPAGLKTFFALMLAQHIARGLPIAGMSVKQGRVAYLYGEGGAGMGKREEAWRIAHGGMAASPNLFFVRFDGSLFDRQVCEQLIAGLRPLGITDIVIDTLAACAVGADENGTKDMGVVVSNIRYIQSSLDQCSVLPVHHTPRSAPDRERGSTQLRGAADTVLLLKRDSNHVSVSCVKQKDLGECDPLTFELQEVTVTGRDEQGAPITSCVLLPSATGAFAAFKGASSWEDKILYALESPDSAYTTGALWQALAGRSDKPSGEFSESLKSLKLRGHIVKSGGARGQWARTDWSRSVRNSQCSNALQCSPEHSEHSSPHDAAA
jgi:hypothetical protein